MTKRFLIVVRLFFSRRRRHTRWPRDWSSDVCSSDLGRRCVVSVENGRHNGDHLLDRRGGGEHVPQTQPGAFGRVLGLQSDHRCVPHQRPEGLPAHAAHGQVDQHHVADAGRGDGQGLGQVRAAPDHPDRVVLLMCEPMHDPDFVAPRGAQHQVDHGVTPWAPGTPITSSRPSSPRTSSTEARSPAGTSTSTAIERIPSELPSSMRRTTASGTSIRALARSPSPCDGPEEVCHSSTVAPITTDSATVDSTGITTGRSGTSADCPSAEIGSSSPASTARVATAPSGIASIEPTYAPTCSPSLISTALSDSGRMGSPGARGDRVTSTGVVSDRRETSSDPISTLASTKTMPTISRGSFHRGLRSLITGAAAVTVASCSPGRGDRSCRGEYDSPVVGAGRQRALWTTPDRPAPHLSTAFTWAGQTGVRRSRSTMRTARPDGPTWKDS